MPELRLPTAAAMLSLIPLISLARCWRRSARTEELRRASMRPLPAAIRSLAAAYPRSRAASRLSTARFACAGTAGRRFRTLGHVTIGVVAARARRVSAPDRTVLSIRTTGQKYEDLSPLRHVVPEASRSALDEFAVMARLPTKSWTCSAPFLMPGCATGLSGLNLPLPLVPQSTVKEPFDAPAPGAALRTLGWTFSMATNWFSSVAASALPLPPLETKVAVRAPDAARTATTMAIRAVGGCTRPARRGVVRTRTPGCLVLRERLRWSSPLADTDGVRQQTGPR